MGTPIIKGTFTTIRWDTDGVLQAGLASAIVDSVRCSTLGGEPHKIDGKKGFTAVVVLLDDGERLELECVDDTALTWPAKGDVISLKGPNDALAKNVLVVDHGSDNPKKREGMRSITVEAYTDITLS